MTWGRGFWSSLRRRLPLFVSAGVTCFFCIATSQAGAQMVTVTPNTGLPENATVQVSGSGFAGTVLYQQCTEIAGGDLRCRGTGSSTTANGSGNFGPVSVAVSRTFSDGGTWDCRVVSCFVWAGDLNGNEARGYIFFAAPTAQTMPTAPTGQAAATGQRDAALARCREKKKKLDWSKKRYARCKRQANQLPV